MRAILALALCGTLWYATIRETAIPTVLVDSALLVVAFYFGVRSTAPVVPAQTSPLAPAKPATVRQPLFLPRGAVRTVLAFGFLAVMGYVAFRDGTIPETLLLVLQVIASYVVGYAFSVAILRRARAGKGLSRGTAVARNLISVAAIGITGGACWAIATGQFGLIPDYLSNGLAWIVAFYFGSRLAT